MAGTMRAEQTSTVESAVPDQAVGMVMSQSAAAKIRELITEEGNEDLSLRVAVRPGGCSGLSYEMYFDSEVSQDDIVSKREGVRVLVDPESFPYLTGAELGFKDDGLQGAGFAITNPNEQRSCGCGKSFC